MNNKIVHTPYNEANNAGGLCKAEKELGLDSTLEVFNNDKYFDTADKVWVRNNNLILKEILRFPMMISILTRYNTIHYNFGSFIAPKFIYEKGKFKFLKKLYNLIYVNLFHGLDVKLAYFLRKKIV
ncbi:MAG: hypothetical protein IE909_17270, partial [Campylobacterales bacterium]|nr:hypothetical protein [Campylobacterales bacterium]